MAGQSEQLLTFSLGNEEYGVSILKVKELIGMMDITPVPRTPQYIKGVMNLRGRIIPVIDLRIKFGMDVQEYNERTCIMVMDIYIQGTPRTMGVIVDSVSEVVSIEDNEIEPPPEYGSTLDADTILGIGKLKEGVVIILDIDKILMINDIQGLMDYTKEGSHV